MASTINQNATPAISSKTSQLTDRLEAVLPAGYCCDVRYIQSPARPCDPLFSALPGQEPERTKLASHFLTVSIDPVSLSHFGEAVRNEAGKGVLSFAIEALVYTTRQLTTIFVSKVDSTPFVPRVKPSPIKSTVTTFLQSLAQGERLKRPDRKVVISLFARAQAQYLFPGSSDDKTKHILDDRQLIKWWARTLDPIIPDVHAPNEDGELDHQGYMTVPGYDRNELRTLMPPTTARPDGKPRWVAGNPLPGLAQSRGLPEHAPPRCLLPRFPDDPKARFMQDLDEEMGISQDLKVTISPSKRKSGRWKSVNDLDRFWEAMEFRQECSSGRLVGFLWLVISPKIAAETGEALAVAKERTADSQDSVILVDSVPDSDSIAFSEPSQTTSGSPTKKKKRKQLTGRIVPRQPRLKGGSSTISNLSDMQLDTQPTDGVIISKEGYDKAMSTLLNLDFSNLQTAIRSTSKWVAEVRAIANLQSDFAIEIRGTSTGEPSGTTSAANGSVTVNDLGGMIRKKRKAGDAVAAETQAASNSEETPAVNVLSAGTIRKKPKAQA